MARCIVAPRTVLIATLIATLTSAEPAAAQNTCGTGAAEFASVVTNYAPGTGITAGTGFGIPSRILCAPGGFADVVSLGVQGTVTTGFDHPIVNGPGTDFIVWENGFEFGGLVFGELAFVEVSTDGTHFARFPNGYFGPQTPMGPFDGFPAGCVRNLAGLGLLLNPAAVTGYSNPCEGGGDAFDLDDLQTHPLVIAGTVLLHDIRHVRLVDILGDGATTDSLGTPIHDPTNATSSSDWDAIAAVHHTHNQHAGRPAVAVAFDHVTRQITLSIADADGLAHLDWNSFLSTFNNQPLDLQALLPFFPGFHLTATSVTITSVPLPPGASGGLCLSIRDLSGLTGADCGTITP